MMFFENATSPPDPRVSAASARNETEVRSLGTARPKGRPGRADVQGFTDYAADAGGGADGVDAAAGVSVASVGTAAGPVAMASACSGPFQYTSMAYPRSAVASLP